MIPLKQNTFHWPEEDTHPLDQEQTATATSSWRGWSPLLRVLGVGLALAGGVILSSVSWGVWGVVTILIAPFVGFGSASLLRSWWAMLIVPVVFSVAMFLGFALTAGGVDQLHIGTSGFWEGVGFAAILGVLPVVVGAIIGGFFGVGWKKRWWW